MILKQLEEAIKNRVRFEIDQSAKSVSMEVLHIVTSYEKSMEKIEVGFDKHKKQLEEIVAMIDEQWPSIYEFEPCKTRCGRDVEAIVKKINKLLEK